MRGVDDLGVELDPVEAAHRVLERADRGRLRRGGHGRSGRWCDDGVAVGHPHRLLFRELVGKRSAEPECSLAELARARAVDTAAELERHQLHAVADAENRYAELEDRGVAARSALRVDRGGAAREDDRRRVRAGRSPQRSHGARRARSRRVPPGRAGRSAASTAHRSRAPAPAARPARALAGSRRPQARR